MILASSIAGLLLTIQAENAVSLPSKASPPCASVEHAAFDFWVGEWNVVQTKDGAKVGESRIERVSGGCAIRESWMPVSGADGTSLSLLNRATDRWEQVWIGSDGTRVDLTGGPADANMMLTGYWDDLGGPGRDALVRVRWKSDIDGNVRQWGEASGDHGATWNAFFDYTYVPRGQ